MDLVSTYYPYVLYAIPYVVAAYVLIRARFRKHRAAQASQTVEEFEFIVSADRAADLNMHARRANDRLPITRMIQRVRSRRAA